MRTASPESRISGKKATAEEIRGLLLDFVRKELDVAMLFLSHLTSIEVREIGVDGEVTVLASATASPRPTAYPDGDSFASYTRTITTVGDAAATICEWSVIQGSSQKEEAIDLLCESLQASKDKEWVKGEVEREKLRPDVALAFPTNAPQAFRGRLFTYLPLPLVTGFPCHIHGVFSLTDSRQNLRNPSETIMRETADA